MGIFGYLFGKPNNTTSTGIRKKALLVGLNYRDTNAQLDGCENDVNSMASLLVSKFGYKRSNVRVLTDKEMSSTSTVTEELNRLFSGAKGGDEFYFHYSGHGTQTTDYDGDETDGLDEALYTWNGLVTDDKINSIIKNLPSGCKLVMVFDCCHSGTIADLRYRYISDNFSKAEGTKKCSANIVSISGCKDNQTSADAFIPLKGDYYGALTSSIVDTLKESDGKEDWISFIGDLQKKMRLGRYSQVPQLSSNFVEDFKGIVKL